MDRTKGKKISQLDNRAIEITQSKEQRKNELKKKKNEQSFGICGTTRNLIFVSSEPPKERRKRAGLKKYLKK